MAVRWGPELITIYNDAYAPLLGERHPRVFGRPTREVWPEIYDRLGPLCHSILRGESGGFFAEDHPWLIQRYGVPEEARFTISYSPIPDAGAESGVGGILVTVFETTERVRNEKHVARAHHAARSRSAAAHPRARPHLAGVGRPARCFQLRGLFHQRQPGLDRPARLERGRNQGAARQQAASSRRRSRRHRRPRAAGAGRADGAHGEPLPPPRRFLALDRLDHDRRRRADLCRRPSRHAPRRRPPSGCAPASSNCAR